MNSRRIRNQSAAVSAVHTVAGDPALTTGSRTRRWQADGAVAAAALASWIATGTITVTAQPSPVRVGLLPSPLWLVAAFVAAVVLRRCVAPPRVIPLAIAVVVVLPWLPLRVPAAFFVWTPHVTTGLWTVLAAGIVLPVIWRRMPRGFTAACASPRRAPWIAGALAAAVYLAAAWQVSPQLPSGDEPHYLVLTQSLVLDRDLKIENNHQQGDYRAYYHGDLKPDYLRRGTDGEIYSIHPIGLPLVIAPFFAAGGYVAVVVFLAVASAFGTALMWTVLWRLTRNAAAAWFGWAAVSLSVPFFFHAFAVYPDALAGVLVMIGISALLSGTSASMRSLWLAGSALAVLPWFHARCAVAAAVVGALLVARQAGAASFARRAMAIVALPIASALAWMAFFYVLYGTPDPRAAYGGYTQTTLANVPRGIVGLLIDQQFGILPNAPVFLVALLGFWRLARSHARLAAELALVIGTYGIAVAAYAMWWGGFSAPARFLVPMLMPLSLPAAMWFQSSHGAGRLVAIGTLIVSILVTAAIALVDRGAMMFNVRTEPSQFWTWLSPLVDLTAALPSVFRTEPGAALVHACVWLAAIGLATASGALVLERSRAMSTASVVMAAVGAVAGMLAMTIVWRSTRAAPLRPISGSLALLHRYDPQSSQIAIRYQPIRRVPLADVPAHLPLLDVTADHSTRGSTVALLEHLPAGRYAIDGVNGPGASGSVGIVLDSQVGPAWTWTLAPGERRWRREFQTPVNIRALALTADESLRRGLQDISMRALAITEPRRRVSDREAADAVRFGSAIVFLVEGVAYMEPGGIWVGGGEDASFVASADAPGTFHLLVRNVPRPNTVTFTVSGHRSTLTLGPDEERTLDVDVAGDTTIRVASARGAKPTDFEKGSTDTRLLGVWLEMR